jgi:hypothetical protein
MRLQAIENHKVNTRYIGLWVGDGFRFNIWPGIKATISIDNESLLIMTYDNRNGGQDIGMHLFEFDAETIDLSIDISCFRVTPIALGRNDQGHIAKVQLAFQRLSEVVTCH